MIALQDRACLVYVQIRNPSFRKTSKALSGEVADGHGAAEDTVAASIRMVPDKYLKPLNKFAQRLRRVSEDHSAVWATKGVRIMLYQSVAALRAAAQDVIDDFDKAADLFTNQYAAIRAEAKLGLSGLGKFVENEWPDVAEVRGMFEAKIGFMPIADISSDFRLTLSDDMAAAMKADMQAEMDAALHEAQADNRARAKVVLGRFVEAVGKYREINDPGAPSGVRVEGGFWAQTVTNVAEVARIVRDLNLIGDAEFTDVCDRMEALGKIAPEHLKLSEEIRTEAIDEAKGLLTALGL